MRAGECVRRCGMTTRTPLASLDRGFRTTYLDYETLLQQLEAWVWAYPDLVRLKEMTRTAEGRRVWLLTLGPKPDDVRPALWLDGNMHASELCGSSVCLATAEAVLALHLGEAGAFDALSPSAQDTIKNSLVHICPRISPDGAEAVLTTGRWVRSVPRDDRPRSSAARWLAKDMNGDGRSLVMRQEDPTGEYVANDAVDSLFHIRDIDDEGPFYKLWPEGEIEDFDGDHVPTPDEHSDNYPDLNRNFAYDWRGEREQVGAGDYPGSEPESRAVLEFARNNPNLFAWVDLHSFGGVGIRPLGDEADNKMNPSDLAMYRQIGSWLDEHTGYPLVSGFEEFTYSPETPLRGDLSEWAYRERGCVSLVVELWDLFKRAGLKRPKRFVDHYTHMTRDDQLAVAKWDAEHNEGRVFRGWERMTHPQLGEVEVGGIDPVVGLWNPPESMLSELCDGMVQVIGRLLAMAPRLHVDLEVETLAPDLHRVVCTVENRGYLSTQVLDSAKGLSVDTAPSARIDGVDVVDVDHIEVGHLDGWGRGRFDGSDTLFAPRSRGTTSRRVVRFLVRGSGEATVRVGCPRTGWVTERCTL